MSIEAEYAELAPATGENTYCKRKGITPPDSVKQGAQGRLVIPVFDGVGTLQSIQNIFPDGRKQFSKDAKMKAGRFVFGELADGELITLCEGFATSASAYESGIGAVVNCFFGSNLAEIAADFRQKFPKSFIRVAGDLDANAKGEEFAKAAVAASMPNSGSILPVFSDGRSAGDFNDLYLFAGVDEVRNQLEKCGPAESDLNVLNNASEGLPSPRLQQFIAPSLAVADARDGTETTRPLSELGNSMRLFDLHGEKLRFIPETRGWIIWRDDAWIWNIDGSSLRATAASLHRQIYDEGAAFGMTQALFFAKWARKSQEQKTINASVTILSDFEPVRLPLSFIDADHFTVGFNQARQVIDLHTGTTRAALPSDFITKSLSADTLGQSAKAVLWMQFLDQVFMDDKCLIDWFQRFTGYLLTGSTREQIFLFLFGNGSNGKSVLIEVLKYIVGDYGRAISPETLSESRRQAGGATPDLAALIGARLVMSAETEDGAAMAESLIKSLVSGDSMAVRQLYSAPIEFTPHFKLVMVGNHKPVVKGNDHGIWRRVRLIQFNRTFTQEERDPYLLGKLKAETPHILAWMVEGCLKWQQKGLADTPDCVKQATNAYQEDQDIVGAWLGECTISKISEETLSGDLYANYRAWSFDNGLRPTSAATLGRRLAERGYSVRKSSSKRIWCGLSLTDSRHDDYARAKGDY